MKKHTEWKVLLRKVGKGDCKAFEELYRLTSQRVWFLCRGFCGNEHDAKDVMQEAYLSVWQNAGQLKEPERFPQWIERIAANKCRDLAKKRKPIPVDDEIFECEEESDEIVLPDVYLKNMEQRRILMDILEKQLTEIQYQTILLYYFSGLSVKEVADIMECREGTVKSRLNSARNKIRIGIETYEQENNDILHGAAPFLTLFLNQEAVCCTAPAFGTVFSAGCTGTAAVLSLSGIKAAAVVSALTVAAGTGTAMFALNNTDVKDAPVVSEVTSYVLETQISSSAAAETIKRQTSCTAKETTITTLTDALETMSLTSAIQTASETTVLTSTMQTTSEAANVTETSAVTLCTTEEPTDPSELYKQAYHDIVISYGVPTSERMYGLIDINGDEIEELIINAPYSWISIYTFSGDSVCTLMERQGYGTYGNWGYDYIPGGNRLRYHINEGAGYISYMYYLTVTPELTIAETDELKEVLFLDTNGNNQYEENEMLEDPLYFLNEQEITKEEFEQHQNSEAFSSLWGNITYEDIIHELE